MERSEALNNEIKRLRRRIRLLLCERWGLFGASIGAIAAAILVALSSKYDELLSYPLWIGVVLLGAIAGVACGLLKKLGDLTIALAADKRTGLKERLSTAVSLDENSGEMADALCSDANERISALRSPEVFKHKFGLPHWIFSGALCVLLAIIFIPQLPAFQSPLRRQEVSVMKREGEKLVKLAKEMKKIDTKNQELRKLADKLQKLGAKMNTGRMSRKQAMLKTQRLEKDIKKEQDRLARQNSPAKSLDKARADMRKNLDKLAESLAKKPAGNKDNKKAAQLMKQIAKSLNSGNMSAAGQKQLASQMAALADALKGTDLGNLAQQMSMDAKKFAQMSPKELQKMIDQAKKMQQMAKLLKKAAGT